MQFNGKELVEMIPETWDGKSREMLVWDDNSKNPLKKLVVGYFPPDNHWMTFGQCAVGCGYQHCAEIPPEAPRLAIKPKYEFIANILNIKEPPKETATALNGERSEKPPTRNYTAMHTSGEEVQYRDRIDCTEWPNPSWNWDRYVYRANPVEEPAATANDDLNTKIKSVKNTRRMTNRELADLMATGNVEKCYPYYEDGRDLTKVYRTHSYYRNKEDSPCAKSILIRYAGTKEWVKPLIEE